MKDELRQRIQRQRLEMSREEIGIKSKNITKILLSLSQYQTAQVLMSYLDFRNEVETGEIITASLKMGKRIAVPISEKSTKKLLPAEIKTYPGDLKEGAYGILEPCQIIPVEPEDIDLVLVPGVAFDKNCNRLGYGAGYYDRFLTRLRPDAATIALAFEMQIVDDVFPEKHDIPLDYVITEERLLKR